MTEVEVRKQRKFRRWRIDGEDETMLREPNLLWPGTKQSANNVRLAILKQDGTVWYRWVSTSQKKQKPKGDTSLRGGQSNTMILLHIRRFARDAGNLTEYTYGSLREG